MIDQTHALKYVGLCLLCLGVAFCAAFGARQSPAMFTHIQDQGLGKATSAKLKLSRTIYDTARVSAQLEPLDAVRPPLPMFKIKKATSKMSAEAQIQTHMRQLGDRVGPHDGALERARIDWLKSMEASLKIGHTLSTAKLPGPMVRVNGWFSESGTLFFLGLILIITGAVLARKAQAVALVKPTNAGASAQFDVPTVVVKLSELSTAVKALSDAARAVESPTVGDAENLKTQIETLHLSHFEPIIEARYRLQASIGLGAFADVFSPLSSGERNFSRAWATLVDEHWPEALSALGRSAIALKRADESLQDVVNSS